MFVSMAPVAVQADIWPLVSGSDQERDNIKVRVGSQRSSVWQKGTIPCGSECTTERVCGCCPHMECVVAAHTHNHSHPDCSKLPS